MAAKQQGKKKGSQKKHKTGKGKQPKRLKQKPKVNIEAKDRLLLTENNVAAANPLTTLDDEISCSICLEPFHNPVVIQCGHSFCRDCITECWKGPFIDACCPICRTCSPTKHLIPNRNLENIVEICKEPGLQNDKNTRSTLERCETKKFGIPAVFDSSEKLLLRSKRHYQTATSVSGSGCSSGSDYASSGSGSDYAVKNEPSCRAVIDSPVSSTSVETGLGKPYCYSYNLRIRPSTSNTVSTFNGAEDDY